MNPIMYKIGNLILLKNEQMSNKFDPLYISPYQIIEISEPNLKINYKGKPVLVHKNRTSRTYSYFI